MKPSTGFLHCILHSESTPVNKQPCEIPNCEERAIMCLYARNPGTPQPDTKRGENPFYPITEADITLNLCVDCFHSTAQQMREAGYVAVRATAYNPKARKQA